MKKPKFIENNRKRNNAFCKRSHSLIKKSMELSMLTGLKVVVVIQDSKREKLIVHQSEDGILVEVKDTPHKIVYSSDLDYNTHKNTKPSSRSLKVPKLISKPKKINPLEMVMFQILAC